MTRLSVYIVLLWSSLGGLAQEVSSVQIQANATRSSIQLRWAPTTPILWEFSKDAGFTLERYTIMRNGQVLSNPEYKVISNKITPAVLPDWEPHMEDDYVAIMAQALYGESFDVSAGSEITQAINRARELENRFSFAMFVADQSLKAADLAGLYFNDEEVFTDEKYLYKIYPNIVSADIRVDTASVFIGLADAVTLPAPRDIEVEFGDNAAVISWNAYTNSKFYNSFWIERSLDGGKSFNRISDKPFVTAENPREKRAYKMDSLNANGVQVAYRVIGRSPFGQLSLPSDTIYGSGYPEFIYAPVITTDSVLQDGGVKIHWDFSEDGMVLLDHFELIKRNTVVGVTVPVSVNIDKHQRQVIDEEPWSGSYYMIHAVDFKGRKTSSFPYLVQLEDSIPPDPPVGLSGSIDTLGVVSIAWTENQEVDLKGYKVFRSNHEGGVYIQLPGPILHTNSYVDTIDIHNLTREIYYKVIALDNRYNPSGYSAELELVKPDLLPPVSPVFKEITSDTLGVMVRWIPSSSVDVARHLLYRREISEPDWTLVKIISSSESDNFYLDRDVTSGSRYAYTVLAVDYSSLESVPAAPVTAQWADRRPMPAVKSLVYQKNNQTLRLSWAYDLQVSSFQVFKADETGKYTLFKSIPGDQVEITDHFKIGAEPRYKVMAIGADGRYSLMSKEVIVR